MYFLWKLKIIHMKPDRKRAMLKSHFAKWKEDPSVELELNISRSLEGLHTFNLSLGKGNCKQFHFSSWDQESFVCQALPGSHFNLAKWDYSRSILPMSAVRYQGLWVSAIEIILPAIENFCAETIWQLNKSRHERMAAAIVQAVQWSI